MEIGVVQREHNLWIMKKPKCLQNSRIVSVGKNELLLVYMILITGMILSTAILMVELLWYRIQKRFALN